MIVMGVDLGIQSKKFAVVILDLSNPNTIELVFEGRSGNSNLKNKNWETSIAQVSRDLDATLKKGYGVELISYEMPPYVKNPQVAIKMGHIGGAVRAVSALHDEGLPVVSVSPQSAKQAITGSGRATKDMVRICAERTLGVQLVSDDTADAVGIALAGVAKFGECNWQSVSQ